VTEDVLVGETPCVGGQVVVATAADAVAGDCDDAMHHRLLGAGRLKPDDVSDLRLAIGVGRNLQQITVAQRRVHAAATVGAEDHLVLADSWWFILRVEQQTS